MNNHQEVLQQASLDEFENWYNLSLTQALFEEIYDRLQSILFSIDDYNNMPSITNEDKQRRSFLLGRKMAYEDILSIVHDDMKEDSENV